MKSGTRVEVGVGKVAEGKEGWMYGEYFPAVGPVMAEYGFETLCSFVVVATNTEGSAPVQGSLSIWPSAENRVQFHRDPRFLEVRAKRDAALEVFSDGHLFQAVDTTIDLDADGDYALTIADANPLATSPILELPLASDSASQSYSGKSMRIHRWNDNAERLLAGPQDGAAIFRIRINAPA